MDLQLTGKRALVTGGSKGIGKATNSSMGCAISSIISAQNSRS